MNIKEQKRAEIIKAAMKVFGKYGFHKAKIEEIAKVAGIGKGTVYEYFSSKNELFEQMVEYIVITYFNMAKEAMEKYRTAREKLLAFAEHHGSFIAHHINMAENILPSSNFLSEEIKSRILEMKKSIVSLIDSTLEEGVKTKELRSDLNIKVATLSILGAINQNYTIEIFLQKIDPDDIDPTPIIDTIFNGLVNK